jgi:hypothetical protein
MPSTLRDIIKPQNVPYQFTTLTKTFVYSAIMSDWLLLFVLVIVLQAAHFTSYRKRNKQSEYLIPSLNIL